MSDEPQPTNAVKCGRWTLNVFDNSSRFGPKMEDIYRSARYGLVMKHGPFDSDVHIDFDSLSDAKNLLRAMLALMELEDPD